MDFTNLDRRGLLRGIGFAGGAAAFTAWMPAWAQPVSLGLAAPLPTVSGTDITLRIAQHTMVIDGRQSAAIGLNGTVPAQIGRAHVRTPVTNAPLVCRPLLETKTQIRLRIHPSV